MVRVSLSSLAHVSLRVELPFHCLHFCIWWCLLTVAYALKRKSSGIRDAKNLAERVASLGIPLYTSWQRFMDLTWGPSPVGQCSTPRAVEKQGCHAAQLLRWTGNLVAL